MDSLLDLVHQLFENNGGSDFDIDSILDSLGDIGGIDLSNYTADDIRSALDYALNLDDHHSIIGDNTHFVSSSNLSFGNYYDDRTKEFVEMMKEYEVEIPSSVNYTSYDNSIVTMDRDIGGGMTSADKNICRNRILSAYDNGKISKDVYDRLMSKLNSC